MLGGADLGLPPLGAVFTQSTLDDTPMALARGREWGNVAVGVLRRLSFGLDGLGVLCVCRCGDSAVFSWKDGRLPVRGRDGVDWRCLFGLADL